MLILLMLFRICWLINILLGISFWSGHFEELIGLHMLLGLLLAALLVVLAIAIGRRNWALSVSGVVIAVLLAIVGLEQTSWLPGPNHWLIQVLHLLLGVAAIAVAEVSGAKLKRSTGDQV